MSGGIYASRWRCPGCRGTGRMEMPEPDDCPGCDGSGIDLSSVGEIVAELEEQRRRADCHKHSLNEVEQALGKSLGYPYLDHRVCPGCIPAVGCTCGDPRVCVGDHVPESLADEAAARLRSLEQAAAEASAWAKELVRQRRILGRGVVILFWCFVVAAVL